jgi:hypothetical protein
MTRRRGMKLVILTTTRWHTDDPVGRLTNSNTDENPYYNEDARQEAQDHQLAGDRRGRRSDGRASLARRCGPTGRTSSISSFWKSSAHFSAR